ncbi:MAG: hypothetical protein CM15mV4_2990 [Caudoviricetes sp.]|nr:MAG: hypothetical protein CM15mV4_2990 [Caudoviricetes sp.]
MRTIRKSPETTTETYETSRKDVGIFIDGVLAYAHKHEDSVLTGPITSIKVDNQGTGTVDLLCLSLTIHLYLATANMSGLVVESVTIVTPGNYTTAPTVDIVSGRNAELMLLSLWVRLQALQSQILVSITLLLLQLELLIER